MKKILLVLIFSVFICFRAEAELVGYWNFDEGIGSSVNDSSGFDNDGGFTPDTLDWVTGKYGSALLFDGTPNEVVTVPYSSSLHLDDSFTIAAWVMPFSTGDNRVIEHYTQPNTMGVILRQAPSPDLGKWQVASTMTNLWSDAEVQQKIWQHIAVTYDGSDMKFYVNGSLDKTVSTSGSLYDGGDPWIIGGTLNDPGAPNSFNGVIDEVKIFNAALTQSEIASNMVVTPEPASMMLFGLGGAAMAFRRFRQKKA